MPTNIDGQIRRMMELAAQHVRSANLLSSRVGDYSSSSTHLQLLAFEIALKAVFVATTGTYATGHNYWTIWSGLPQATRTEVVEVAKCRNAGHVNYSDMQEILKDLKSAFSRGRYDYEYSRDQTEAQIFERSKKWIDDGAQESNADLRFHPMERDGLIYGFKDQIERRIGIEFEFDD